jgi:hypothetical protein
LLTDPELDRVREEERGRMLTLLTAPRDAEADPKSNMASVEAQQPVRIATFEVS